MATVGCVLLNDQNKVMLLHGKNNGWEIPTATAEPGEDPALIAAVRVQELLGALVSVTGDLEQTGDCHWYMAVVTSGVPRLTSHRYDDLQYFTWDELVQRHDLSAATRLLVEAMPEGTQQRIESRQRRTRNEVVVEAHNRRTKQLAERVLDNDSKASLPLAFTCECSDATCGEKISLSVAEWTMAHQRVDYFTIKPGHEQTDIERVVATYPADGQPVYSVVEKLLIARKA